MQLLWYLIGLRRKSDELSAEYDGSGDYAEFVKQITLNMKGDIKQIIYVDRYTHNSNYRKRLNSFSDAINELIPGALFDLVTAHTPYTQHHENQGQKSTEFKTKLLQFCNQVYFMEDTGGKIPHDRVIIIRSNSETRCWCLTFGITAKNRSVPAMKIDETKLEPSLLNHLKVTKGKKGGIIMRETSIVTITNQKKVDRTGEALGPTWTSSKSPAKSIVKKGPFLFTGEGSEIPSSISALIESSKERLLVSTQSFFGYYYHPSDRKRALERGVRVYMVVDSTGFESVLNNPSCNALHGNVLLRERQSAVSIS